MRRFAFGFEWLFAVKRSLANGRHKRKSVFDFQGTMRCCYLCAVAATLLPLRYRSLTNQPEATGGPEALGDCNQKLVLGYVWFAHSGATFESGT